MANVKHFTASDFQEQVVKSETPVLVDFWAEWCVPCRHIAPIVEEVAGEYVGKLVVGKYDVDGGPQTASQYGIVSIPTLLLFKNGEVVDRRVGVLSKKDLKKMIDEHVK